MQNNSIITTTDLTKKFGNFVACNALTMEVKQGEIFGFLGANGAGKTTAIKMLCGILKPTSGKATIAGFDIYKQSEKIKQCIGYMSQKFSLYQDLTVKENIQFYGGIYQLSRQEIKQSSALMIEQLNIGEYENKLVKELPLGLKQKLAFSVALIHRPQILFLDEPTSGVDPVTRRQFWEMIYKTADEGTTVFITTHYLDEAEYCNRLSIMVDGVMKAYDTPAAVKQQYDAKNINEVFLKLTRSHEIA